MINRHHFYNSPQKWGFVVEIWPVIQHHRYCHTDDSNLVEFRGYFIRVICDNPGNIFVWLYFDIHSFTEIYKNHISIVSLSWPLRERHVWTAGQIS